MLVQPQMFTGLSPAPAAPPRCAGGGALLSPGPGRAGRRRASQESMAATASCSSGTPQPSSQRPPHGGHDALVITQEPRRSGGHTTAIARRPSCRSRHKDSCHTPFTRRCSMPRPGWGVQILIADQRLWASRVRTPQPPAPRSVDPLPGRATLGKLLNASSGRLGSITHSDSRKGK